MVKKNDSNNAYDYWYDLYYLLSSLPLDDGKYRQSSATLKRLQDAKWGVDFVILENYWKRVDWVSKNSTGVVLEIGCGMGNITRWIAKKPFVKKVIAIDVLPKYISVLKSFEWEKVIPYCLDLRVSSDRLLEYAPFDTVVLCELIEHLSTKEEIELLRTFRPLISSGARVILTTPINYMEDPDHVRGFRSFHFKWRSSMLYGSVKVSADNSMQQFVLCEFQNRGGLFNFLLENMVKFLDYFFEVRPSGHPYKYPIVIYKFFRKMKRSLLSE
jgi:2-polyprenyl-3-methyl-5-hydroxy-6-metoxy-1,4-benzoquinol methylase